MIINGKIVESDDEILAIGLLSDEEIDLYYSFREKFKEEIDKLLGEVENEPQNEL